MLDENEIKISLIDLNVKLFQFDKDGYYVSRKESENCK